MVDDLKNKLWEEQHPRLAKLGRYMQEHPNKFLSIGFFGFVVPSSALYLYFFLGCLTGDYNPITQWETEGRQHKEYVSEIQRLRDLKDKVMRKAESVDGLPGMSFSEQSLLAKSLGYTGTIVEGNYRGNFGRLFDLQISVDKKIILWIGTDSFECSEKSLEQYLKE